MIFLQGQSHPTASGQAKIPSGNQAAFLIPPWPSPQAWWSQLPLCCCTG